MPQNYLGWRIYIRKRRAGRRKMIKDLKKRFQGWNCEEKDKELKLIDPEYGAPVVIRFGEFITPSQQKFFIEIESRSWAWKRGQERDHLMVLSRVLKMLPKGKKELYKITPDGLDRLSIKGMKHFEDVLTGYRGYY